MVPSSLWATAALIPLLIPQATALIFELSPQVNKRHSRLAQKAKRLSPVLPATWSALGCYTDGPQRALNRQGFQADTMTVDSCVAYCDTNGYIYAGVEYSRECYCDNAIQSGNIPATSGCDMMCAGDATQTCGGGYRLNVYESSKPATSALATYNGWGYQGCYTDSTIARSLTVTMAVEAPLTPQKCLDACQAQNYLYAGLEYSVECYCGNTISNGGALATDQTTCDMTCAGDVESFCGGGDRLTLYQYGATAVTTSTSTTSTSTSTSASATATGPTTLDSYNGWTSEGCFVDSVAARTLPIVMEVTGGQASMTVQLCLDACHANNYAFAGLEYSQECYCGSTIPPQVATDGRCSMVCNGDQLHYCGGANGLNVYQYDTATSPTVLASYGNWQSQGCWSDDPAQRSLSFTANTGGANTPQKCMDTCYAAGYSYAGVEYAVECYCGNEVVNGGSLQADEGCDMICSEGSNYCGGPNRLNLYEYNDDSAPPPTNPPPVNAVGPVTTGLPAPWYYAACYVDGQFGPILGYTVVPSAINSAASCIAACQAQGFTLAGMENAQECYCGNALQNGATQATADTDCAISCSGDAQEACGGTNRVSLYASVQPFTTYPPPTPKKTGLPGQYQYQGCFAEPGQGQTIFQYNITDEVGMSVETCLNQCSLYRYSAAALDSGDECWCGDASMVPPSNAAPEADCNMGCTGSPLDSCGGDNRFILYSWDMTTNPLYVWNTPANTGLYEVLIDGIDIPLIATLGINNKVTFMDREDTSPLNSTGAYEFDYSLVYDHTKAWREMHVASDVFCAANLVLPDKGGRVLSVGGSSLASKDGIRLYMPSGSQGSNGTTDWEEQFDKVHLQQGRCYPGVMQMTNGSILVIGGEDGSDGTPVPTLEILPTPDGGSTYLEMDWLLSTAPNNLYPFSFVLPDASGRIFVIYYNEARILDSASFATTATLPTIPGQVNAVGGRTYPMEGTAVILPLRAPYTDPIEIIACGGSAFGQALDNCVSITPEVPNAQWVIERMPSKRVMPLMTALPDGTYLILGGAQQGVAGFGLATNANLQAILYDPSQPRHHRFSILGTTTIPRLYHSEAILLPDGRVLVTGSDPEDEVNPQEYRIEVYIPPYLTVGFAQPTFHTNNIEWAWGGFYTIIVNLFQGSTNTMTVSLMGAVSSTHGNSFGQRTVFLSFRCAGNTCLITAPPNGVCPPGWYQLFILDGPTPSVSHWVNIGGDPALVGNWPDYPGFTLPGI